MLSKIIAYVLLSAVVILLMLGLVYIGMLLR
jgi:hypothetical protein